MNSVMLNLFQHLATYTGCQTLKQVQGDIGDYLHTLHKHNFYAIMLV